MGVLVLPCERMLATFFLKKPLVFRIVFWKRGCALVLSDTRLG